MGNDKQWKNQPFRELKGALAQGATKAPAAPSSSDGAAGRVAASKGHGGLARERSAKQPKKSAPPTVPELPPSARSTGNERIAYLQAYQGVQPLAGAARKIAAPRAAPVVQAVHESTAALNLARLVGGGVRFHVHSTGDGYVEGYRLGAVRGREVDGPQALATLLGRSVHVHDAVDLHGCRVDELEQKLLSRFHTATQKASGSGAERYAVVRVVHGRGNHSEDGQAPVRAWVHQHLALAPLSAWVFAFASASGALGGVGATLVYLKRFS